MEDTKIIKQVIKEALNCIKSHKKVLENIPYRQVVTGDVLSKHTKQYVLQYSYYFGSQTTVSSYYAFSMEKLKQIISVADSANARFQRELLKIIKAHNLSDAIKEEVLKSARHFGYTIEYIREAKEWRKAYNISRVNPSILRKEMYDNSEPKCVMCNDRGCVYCEPHRFM